MNQYNIAKTDGQLLIYVADAVSPFIRYLWSEIVSRFLVFVCLPIYCVYTQFLKKILSLFLFFSFSPAL